MAKQIHAIREYCPRIIRTQTISINTVVEFIEGRTGINESIILAVLMELRAAMGFYMKNSEAVKLPGLGTFAPTIDLDGKINIAHWPDRKLLIKLNIKDAYIGDIQNKDMIGKTSADLIARWNEAHPDDPVEETQGKPGKPKDK